MTATRVKICGIRTEEDLALAVDAGADAVGLICSVPVDTPREISEKRATLLASRTPPFVNSVLVTMGETIDEINAVIDIIRPDVVQVHGKHAPEAVARLTNSLPVIRAMDVDSVDAVRETAPYVDAILLDSTDEHGAGGTGETHDWDRSRELVDELDTPVILAGGLTPENVAEAIETVRPFGVDVASGVEADAEKDPAAVRRFVAEAAVAPRGDDR